MSNPQLEDGFLGIAHSINEAIMLRDFTKRQRKILDLILRYSWGCNKKEAYIPHQRDFTVLGIYESDIKKELRWLEESKVIAIFDYFYCFNKDFDEWQVSRVKPFNPEKLSELLSLNLNGNAPKLSSKLLSNDTELSKTQSKNLVKHKVKTSQNTKFSTPDLATSKEILKKYIKKDDTDINDINKVVLKPDGTIDENETIVHYASLFTVRQILSGERECLESNKRIYREELAKLGIPE